MLLLIRLQFIFSVPLRRGNDGADGGAVGGLDPVRQVDVHRPPLAAPDVLGLLLGVAAVAAVQRHRVKVCQKSRRIGCVIPHCKLTCGIISVQGGPSRLGPGLG